MGNLGKQLNLDPSGPVRGPWNPGVVTGVVLRGVTCETGSLVALVSEHSVQSGKVFMVPKGVTVNFCAKRPHTCL